MALPEDTVGWQFTGLGPNDADLTVLRWQTAHWWDYTAGTWHNDQWRRRLAEGAATRRSMAGEKCNVSLSAPPHNTIREGLRAFVGILDRQVDTELTAPEGPRALVIVNPEKLRPDLRTGLTYLGFVAVQDGLVVPASDLGLLQSVLREIVPELLSVRPLPGSPGGSTPQLLPIRPLPSS